ncbi:hypothetical protein GOP47_0025534 [Adiantum capillus-veneris]|uniref:Syntaxin 6/10/61 N-terminal domain-containing protein n=1 Tax=Adiantum capillus-veneris TaxID=13818 RepID=A0A9D4Z315_ADICA|nr:hypothetical protein GOP47_0025534 [Adiantum capillus-veneris]
MTRNFHRWEVDPFFSAAEEVQDSADRLESVYRTWMHAKSVADDIALIEFHRRELSTALGTAKWQLEEFERAVSCITVDDCDQAGDDAPSRHKQFVDALQNQISTIEIALSISEACKDLKPHQGLRLEEKEKDDLELFLCGTRSSKEVSSTAFKLGRADEVARCSGLPLEHKNGVLSRISTSAVDSDVDSGVPNSDVCPWTQDTGSSDKPLPDLHEAGSVSGRRIDEISKPVSDPTPEYFYNDRGEHYGERVNGHHRSVSVGSGLNAWKSGSMTDGRGNRRRLISVQIPSNRLNFWAIFSKVRHARKFKSGLKRWKDGDTNPRDSEMLSLLQGIQDIEQGNQTSCFGAKPDCLSRSAFGDLPNGDKKHHRTLGEGLQIWPRTQYSLPSSRLVQIASAILVALGLVG